jgi:hypothetical protein
MSTSSGQERRVISHHDKCVFVHVPKCAGQSIERFFLTRVGLDWEQRAPLLLRPNDNPDLGPPRLAHLKAHEYVDKKWMTPLQFASYFKFAFVRNPWDRTASFYRFLGYDRRCSFGRFVRFHLPRLLEKKAWFLCPQVDYLFDQEDRLLVDFVGRFEQLSDDFRMVCRQLDIAASPLPHVNDSRHGLQDVTRWLRRRPKPYRDMFDSRSRTVVARLYSADIDAFKYGFHPDRTFQIGNGPSDAARESITMAAATLPIAIGAQQVPASASASDARLVG